MIRSFVLKEDDVKELYYSYHTCGSLDTYSENALQEEVAGGTMRTTFAVGIQNMYAHTSVTCVAWNYLCARACVCVQHSEICCMQPNMRRYRCMFLMTSV
jgi:hypothetical protein